MTAKQTVNQTSEKTRVRAEAVLHVTVGESLAKAGQRANGRCKRWKRYKGASLCGRISVSALRR